MFVGAVLTMAAVVFGVFGCSAEGLSRAEVDQLIQDAVEEAEVLQSVTMNEVDEAIGEAIAEALDGVAANDPAQQISVEEIEDLVAAAVRRATGDQASGVADAAADDAGALAVMRVEDPAGYTVHVVDSAIARFDAEGLEATVGYYNDAANVDGQWYVIIIDSEGDVIAHYDPDRRGLNLNEWVGTDINGYQFGPQMLTADHNGKWVPYVYTNPAKSTLGGDGGDTFELKQAWAVRHSELLFVSGWYIDADEYLPALIAQAAERFRAGGLEATLAFYTDPQGISAGLIPTVEYYNSTDTLGSYFAGIIADPDGTIISHFDPTLIGTDIEDLLGPAVRNATPAGTWITADDNPPGSGGPATMRFWLQDVEGTLIGGGWYDNTDA